MRRSLLPVLAPILAAALPAFAAGENVRLPQGEILEVMHPGVDGVGTPRAVAGWTAPPGYPLSALDLGEDSTVTVAVLVRANGTVATAEVLHAEHPDRGFERAAVEAVSDWRFRPARQDRRPVHSYTFVKLRFRAPESPASARFDAGLLPGGPLPATGTTPAVGLTAGGLTPAFHRGGFERVQLPQYGPGMLYFRNPASSGNGVTPLPRVPLVTVPR